MVKFLLHNDWGGEGAKTTQLRTPSPTKPCDSSQLSSPEQQQKEGEGEEEEEKTPQEKERETESSAEQQETKKELDKKHQETQPQQQHEAFSKSNAIQQALVAAASMGHIEVIYFNYLFIPFVLIVSKTQHSGAEMVAKFICREIYIQHLWKDRFS